MELQTRPTAPEPPPEPPPHDGRITRSERAFLRQVLRLDAECPVAALFQAMFGGAGVDGPSGLAGAAS